MRILEQLPISEVGWVVPTPDGVEEAKPFQIILLVSIADQSIIDLPADAPRFPAILDTGLNHNFAMRREQFDRWAPIGVPQVGRVEVQRFSVPLLAANVWIHPNRAGTIEPSGQPLFCLELKGGIAVYPPNVPNPARLPTLGLRGLIRNNLRLTIDGEGRHLTLESPST
jgi:hypothetical protein